MFKWFKKIYNNIMGIDNQKDELAKDEEQANMLLDAFMEKYDELHRLIHHRDNKEEQKKLKKEFPDIFYKDEEAQKNLIKLARFVNKKLRKNGK